MSRQKESYRFSTPDTGPATLSANTALLTIEFVPPPPAEVTQVIQFGIARSQCTELGQALLRLAIQTHNPSAALS